MTVRVVLDTNVIVSATIVEVGPPALLLRAARKRKVVLVTSLELLSELSRTLVRDRVVRRIPGGSLDAARAVAMVRTLAEVVEPTQSLNLVERDPADNRVIEAAVAGNADYIVSGDEDLLSLGVAAGIPVVSPARMLEILAAAPG